MAYSVVNHFVAKYTF